MLTVWAYSVVVDHYTLTTCRRGALLTLSQLVFRIQQFCTNLSAEEIGHDNHMPYCVDHVGRHRDFRLPPLGAYWSSFQEALPPIDD